MDHRAGSNTEKILKNWIFLPSQYQIFNHKKFPGTIWQFPPMSCLHSYLSFKLSVRDKTSNWWIFPNTNLEHTPHKYLQQIPNNDIFHTSW